MNRPHPANRPSARSPDDWAPPPAGREQRGAAARPEQLPTFESAIVPPQMIAGRALILVVAIMTFLCALAAGAVSVVQSAARDWQSEIAREITIELRPVEGLLATSQIEQAVRAVEGMPGIGAVRPLSARETGALLEPWLGADVDIASLPVPRLVAVEVADPAAFDVEAVRAALANVPGSRVDDHRTWNAELATAARAVTIAGVALLALMLLALALTVVFATRAAMASNAQTIEVLHFCGAESRFIAREFQRHFLVLGLKGGLIGGGVALALFVVADVLAMRGIGGAAVSQATVLVGDVRIGAPGYMAVAIIIVLVAALTAITTRLAVHGRLGRLD